MCVYVCVRQMGPPIAHSSLPDPLNPPLHRLQEREAKLVALLRERLALYPRLGKEGFEQVRH